MSKRKQLENLSVFIGLRAAHEILIKLTGKPESKHHLEQEADTYTDLGFDLAEGNWNKEDIEKIRKLSKRKCNNKLGKYRDIGDEKYNGVERVVENIMIDLGLI